MMDSRYRAETCPRCLGTSKESRKRNGVVEIVPCRACGDRLQEGDVERRKPVIPARRPRPLPM